MKCEIIVTEIGISDLEQRINKVIKDKEDVKVEIHPGENGRHIACVLYKRKDDK